MTKTYIPSSGANSWQQFLADPQKQWKTGYSARTLAYSWEEADGFPKEIGEAFANSDVVALKDTTPLLIIPEHKVPIPGGAAASQNDVFVLASTRTGLVTICVEGKVEEAFGESVSKWGPDSTPGKRKRFDFLVGLLELGQEDLSDIYYQLLHRTASAIIEAKRFHASTAVMLVHSFSQAHTRFPDYCDFAGKLGVEAELNKMYFCGNRSGIDLYVGWVVGNAEYLTR